MRISGTPAYPFAAPPFFVFLASIASGSSVVAWFLGISIVVTFFTVLWAQFMQPMRALFAYAFDGVLPLWLARVSPRTRVPVAALSVVTAIMLGLLVWAVYGGNFFTVYATAVLVTVVSLLLMSVAVIVFAGRRSEVWRASVANGRIGGVAITTIAGWGAIVVAILNGYFYLHYTGLGLTNRGEAYRNVGIVVALALVIYFVAARVRARQGIRLDRAASEIPPE